MSYLLAHLSDAHIGPLPRPRTRDLLGKRITGFVNWRKRGRLHDMAVLAPIVADLHAQAPDHVAMTGDILNLGLPSEFPFARAWLETLGHGERRQLRARQPRRLRALVAAAPRRHLRALGGGESAPSTGCPSPSPTCAGAARWR